MISQSPLVSLWREGFEEITVYGEIVATDGAMQWSASGAVGRYPMRSLLKPFQFLACELPEARWSGPAGLRYVPCVGSVSASEEQVRSLQSWYAEERLARFAAGIQVPPTLPLDPENRVWARAGGPKTQYHTCFSKHAAVLEACELRGWDPKTYLSTQHPFHRRLLAVLGELLGRDPGTLPFVTDGCRLPTPVLSLADMGRLYQRLASAEESHALGKIRRLMLSSPEWIGGPERVDTRLMEANEGRVVAKEGADGLLGLAVLPTAEHPRGLGAVVKVASGFDMKAAALALAPLLDTLDLEGVHEVPMGQQAQWHYTPLASGRTPLLDISPGVGPQTAVWPGDVPFRREVSLDTLHGHHLTLSSLSTTVHVGAHADAPNHYEASDRGIDTVDLTKYAGPCQVISVRKAPGTCVMPGDLAAVELRAARVLLRTGSFPDPDRFNTDFVSLSGELVEWLGDRGVCLVGIDTPSIDRFDSKDLPSHKATLKTGIAVLEGIVLDGVEDGLYELSALPLRLQGADASPVRAVLRP